MNFKKYCLVILGAALMAFSLDAFLVPAQIAPGGVSGLATVFGYYANIPVGIMIFLINIPIFIWGLFEFDGKFLISSVIGTAALSLLTEVFAPFVAPVTDNEVLMSVFGGALLGLGAATVLRSGATTGGTEIIAKILKRRFPYFSIGVFILIVDTAVVIFASLVSGRWETMLFSGLALYVSTKVIDGIIDGVNFAKMVLIISSKPEKITQAVYEKMQRGVTQLLGYSDYTKESKKVVMCVVRRNEIVKLKELVKKTDENSFVIVADVREVQGNGFARS